MTDQPKKRKGAIRRADVPPDVLKALNEGREESLTLAEYLAVDMPLLFRNILSEVGLGDQLGCLGTAGDKLADLGVSARSKGFGALLYDATANHPDHRAITENIATHRSDTVRMWAAYMPLADGSLSISEHLDAVRRFAADPSMNVKESAWDSFRPRVLGNLGEGLKLLEPWVHDPDPNIRRCAVEGTRPCGVWTKHCQELKDDPAQAMPLLEPVRSDPSRYVQTAAANWLNDSSKYAPDWTIDLCSRWLQESPTKETRWLVNHALRTLRKHGRDDLPKTTKQI